MSSTVQWGIIGAGNIARAFARSLANSTTGRLVAVGSRSRQKADRFAAEFNVSRAHGSYEALLADDHVQVVYVATPHPHHAEWSIRAAEAGKHILCEKPLALNHAEAMAVIEAAIRYDVFLMEAFMYRCHPQTAKLVELLRNGVIGDVRIIQASFGFHTGYDPDARLFNNELGGGGILDVGCYCISMARLVAGVATGQDFAEPIEVSGSAHLGDTGVDGWAIGSLRFPGDILAQVTAAVQVSQDNVLEIFGSEGTIVVPTPWTPSRDGGTSRLIIHHRSESEPQEILIDTAKGLFTIEADTVAEYLDRRQAAPPAMTWEDTLGNMKTLDRWREAVGLEYGIEKPQAMLLPVHKRPLAVREDHNMRYGEIPGVGKPVSRLVMGVDNQVTMPHAAVMFDDFFERGGNCFDTAYIYGGGICERLLGQWIRNRNIREQVVILSKGAHTPFCTPHDLTRQLQESLQRLQTDYVDIYMLHRDNPDVPVGEFIDVLNEHRNAGIIQAFGASNWSIERIEAANHYAETKGFAGFSAVSNNFSLARIVEVPWTGCMASSDTESRDWFTRTQTPLMPWSSQARGFFTRAHADDRSDAELVRCWYCEENFQRLERAREMADRLSVLPVNIALAYVLCQPFPTFPLVGPHTLAETRTSIPALDIQLTPEDLRWLDLE